MINFAKTVLVTGSLGFTGYYVTQALENKGYHVIHFTNDSLSSGKPLDLCDYSTVKDFISKNRPKNVIHLAAIAYVGHGDPWDFYKVNLGGSLNLLRALDEVDCVEGNIVVASSANIYGDAYQGIAIEESFEPKPVNDYAVSKLALEKMIELWRNRFNIIVTRPFNYTGVGQSIDFLVPKIVNAFKKRDSVIELGNLDVHRDYSDVRDDAKAYASLLELNKKNLTVNLCSGKLVSLRTIIKTAEELTSHHLEIIRRGHLIRKNEILSLCGNPKVLNEKCNIWFKISLNETLKFMLLNSDQLT